jgi:hypothetical protein
MSSYILIFKTNIEIFLFLLNVLNFSFPQFFARTAHLAPAGWTVPFGHRASSFIFLYFIPASLCTGLRNSRAKARQTGTKALLLCLKLLRRRRGDRRNHRPEAVARVRIAIAADEVKRARTRAIAVVAATMEPWRAGVRHI